MGRVVLPGPFFSTVCLGGMAILEAGTSEQKQRLLPGIASGKTKATLAVLEENARWDDKGVKLSARKTKKGYTLSGVKLFVPDAHVADVIVCAARASDGITLFLLDRQQAGVSTTLLKTMDQTRKLCEVRLDKVQVNAEAVLGTPGEGWKALARIFECSKVALCAEMCGGAQRVLDMSVEYAKVREQFGRPIGSFQAIQHKCANMLVQVESAKSATYYAAWAVANNVPEASVVSASPGSMTCTSTSNGRKARR
jgi:alkylation response protein AidB-like acyl-CoA dehydrogenase